MNYQKYFVDQKTEAECGVACLLTVFKVFGFHVPKELIVKLSGTSNTGTSLLGIHEAASRLGLKSQGYEGSIEDLKILNCPLILHVVINDSILHYVVCLKHFRNKFIISDPARGIIELSKAELEQIWKSKRLLMFEKEIDNAIFNEVISKAKKIKQLKLFDLFENDLHHLIKAVLLGLAVSILGLATPLFIKFLIDDFDKDALSISRLGTILLILFVTLIFRSLLSFIREQIFLNQSIKFNKRITAYFFKKLLSLPITFFDGMRKGDLVTRMNDTLRIQSATKYFFGSLAIEIFILLGGIIFIAVILPILALTIAGLRFSF